MPRTVKKSGIAGSTAAGITAVAGAGIAGSFSADAVIQRILDDGINKVGEAIHTAEEKIIAGRGETMEILKELRENLSAQLIEISGTLEDQLQQAAAHQEENLNALAHTLEERLQSCCTDLLTRIQQTVEEGCSAIKESGGSIRSEIDTQLQESIQQINATRSTNMPALQGHEGGAVFFDSPEEEETTIG